MKSCGQLQRTTISGENVFFVTTSDGQNVYLVSLTQVADELVLLAPQLPNNKKIFVKISKHIDVDIVDGIRDIVSHHLARIEILEDIDLLELVDIPKEDAAAAGRRWSPLLKWIAIPIIALILFAGRPKFPP